MTKELEKKLTVLKDNHDLVRRKYCVKNIGIFGSFSTGKSHSKSDVDVLVDFKSPISLFEFLELEEFLSKAMKRKVDLVSKKGLKKAIRKDVLNQTVYA